MANVTAPLAPELAAVEGGSYGGASVHYGAMAGDSSLDITERWRITEQLFQTGIALMRQNLVRWFPTATDSEREAMFRDWLNYRREPPVAGRR